MKIFIDRLRDGDTQQIFEVLDVALFDIAEKDLSLEDTVTVSGAAYLAKNHLVLDLKVKAQVAIPCSICNDFYKIPVELDSFTQTIELDGIKGAIYDLTEDIRTNILLKVPQFFECHDGHCPSRKEVSKFLKASL